MLEHFFQCPYCWEEISMLLDTSVSTQAYVEDCEVCCNPIEVTASFTGNELVEFRCSPLGQ
ncbi:CPXCG motif-containing cysteine-rich protein [Muricauda sp. SCSIO 64092]|uniref:CPXCG motif-containing cysteine-rich protein n=1 Tax=Allomuricauda sp. SCSIO 64092 TaxID=2908842 RepID=UPI001FF3C3B3|nr:CPXCG motif-containing cysteine-rich protein [Muricauda sp. SCSIO 64092]UOY08140.1 CPXCG motif-containing cysteine-rich protein [Muricauda sp. SCSIO 64092]